MKKLPPDELATLLSKFNNTELFYIEMRHRYAAYQEFPELVDYLQWCAAKKENDIEKINELSAIPHNLNR